MKESSLSKGFAVLSAAGLLVKILSLLYIPFLLAIIGDEGNGIYSAAYQVYVFVYMITNAGTPSAISKLVSELMAVHNYRDAVRSFKIARFIFLIVGTVMSLLMIATAGPLSRTLHFDRSYLAIIALAPTLLFTSVASAYRGYFQGRGNMVPTAVSQVLEQIANTIFTLIFAALLLRYGLEAACAGGTIGTSLGAVFSVVFLLLYYQKNKKFKVPKEFINIEVHRYSYSELLRKILSYSIPITVCVGLQYGGNLVDVWNTKTRLEAGGLTDSGATILYSYLVKYQQLMNAPIAIIVALSATVLPALAGAIAIQNKEEIQNKINYAFRFCFLISLPAAVGLSILSSPIYRLLGYRGGSILMLYGSFILVLTAMVQIQTTVLQSSSRLYAVTVHLVFGIIAKILTNYFTIPYIGISGAILGSLVSYLIIIYLNNRLIQNVLKIRLNLTFLIIKPLLSALFMGFLVYIAYFGVSHALGVISQGYFFNAISVLLAVAIGGVAYFCGLIITGCVTQADLAQFPKKVTRLIPPFVKQRIKT